jgi:hypothetical protein
MIHNKLAILILVIFVVLYWVWFFSTYNQLGTYYYYYNKKYKIRKKLYTHDTYVIMVNGVICSDMIHINYENDDLVYKAIKLYLRKKELW